MKCQACQSAHAQVYCQESQAALCNGCSYVMGDITRYRLCALCDCNPARIFCRNDNAALCDACDADIHLSNPLAVRHDRVALGPLDAEPAQVGAPAMRVGSRSAPWERALCELYPWIRQRQRWALGPEQARACCFGVMHGNLARICWLALGLGLGEGIRTRKFPAPCSGWCGALGGGRPEQGRLLGVFGALRRAWVTR